MSTHQSRSIARSLALVSLAVALLMMALAVANPGAALQINPTVEPGTRLQANPTSTSTPDRPIRVSPTEPPQQPPGGFQANPTEAPPRQPGDVQTNPTQPPQVDDEAIPTTGTVRVEKRDCPVGVPEDALLTDYLEICTQPHDGVEFVVNDIDGAQAGVTSGGQVEWTGVDPGVFNITETIPAGYGDPIVFCGYTESPGGGVQHPALQNAVGGIVTGTFPDATFEFVCYWMNVKTGELSNLTVQKKICPFGMDTSLPSGQLAEECTTPLDGVDITVTHANGSSTRQTVGGEAHWEYLPHWPYTVEETIPAGYESVAVECSIKGFGPDDDPDFHLISFDAVENGVFELTDEDPPPELPEVAYIQGTCVLYNVPLEPDTVASPEGGDADGTVTVHKHTCPEGVGTGLGLYEYREQCTDQGNGVEFTLTNADGDSTQPVSGGVAEWDGLPLGQFTIQEELPTELGDPIVFCSWTAFHDGAVYDSFAQPVPATGGLIEHELVVPNTSMLCEFFNLQPGSTGFTSAPGALEGRLT